MSEFIIIIFAHFLILLGSQNQCTGLLKRNFSANLWTSSNYEIGESSQQQKPNFLDNSRSQFFNNFHKNNLQTFGLSATANSNLRLKNDKNNFRQCEQMKKINASFDGQIPVKNRFSYSNQLKIMLSNKLASESNRISSEIALFGRERGNKLATKIYTIYALQKAIKLIDSLPKEMNQRNETTFLFKIASSMWTGIKDLNRENDATDNGKANDSNDNNKNKDTRKSNEQITETKEQMRFIGLVLWHLVVRDSPIHDPENDEFVFIAKMMPDIDPIGQEWSQNLMRFDYNLDRLLDRPNGGLLPFVPFLRVHIEPNEYEIFQHLNAKIGKQNAVAFGDKEKWEELNKKNVLLARNRNAAQFFNHVYTPFLVFGKHTAPIILFIRALLEGLLDEGQVDQFLIDDDRWPIIEHLIENHNSYKRMLNRLIIVSKQLGYRH